MKRVVVLVLFIICISFLYRSIVYQDIQIEPDIDKLLQQKATKNYLEEKIKNYIKQKKFEEAKSFISLANYLHVPLSKNYKKEIEDQNTLFFQAGQFAKGFISGETKTSTQLYGAVTSDFTVVGDIRDIKNEGSKYLQNKPYDEFLLGISVAGLALALTPLKVGTTLLKTAKKTKSLTKGFTKYLTKTFSKTYDKKVFKQIDFTDMESIKKAVKTINLTPVKAPLKKLAKIESATSFADTVSLLKYIDNEKDLAKVAKISQKYKKNTKAVFKVLGKTAIRGTKKVLLFSYELLAYLLGSFFTLVLLFIPFKSKKV